MQEVQDLCPKCGVNLDLREVPPEWASFYPDQKRWARKTMVIFRDPGDGETYCIWRCGYCGHTWDDYEKD